MVPSRRHDTIEEEDWLAKIIIGFLRRDLVGGIEIVHVDDDIPLRQDPNPVQKRQKRDIQLTYPSRFNVVTCLNTIDSAITHPISLFNFPCSADPYPVSRTLDETGTSIRVYSGTIFTPKINATW